MPAEHMYANFAETSRDGSSFHRGTAHHRLKRIEEQADPENLIRAGREL